MRSRRQFIAFAIVPVAFLVYAVAFVAAVRDVSREAALYPRLLIGVFVPLLLIAALLEWRTAPASPGDAEPSADSDGLSVRQAIAIVLKDWQQAIVTVLLIFVYLWTIPRLGFYSTTTIFVAAGAAVLKAGRWWLILALAVGTTVVSYLLFGRLLGAPLPPGILF